MEQPPLRRKTVCRKTEGHDRLGKELVLRLVNNFRVHRAVGRPASMFMSITSIALFALLGSGCKNGFIDPSEMGQYERNPTALPIPSKLDIGDFETDPRFRNA